MVHEVKTVVYARVSSDRQEEDGTIESQIDSIRHHPTTRGKQIVEIYADNGVSGYTKPLWGRPEGARLLADAEAGKWKGCELLVSRLNRLGRRAREIEEAIDRLLACEVTVYSVKEGYKFDNQTPMGKFTRQLFASLAELDRNTIVDTTRDGMVRKARQGALMPTYARLGYEWSAVDERGRKRPGAVLVVNDREAPLVRLIFEKYPAMTLNGLVKWLNAQGHRLPCKSPKLRERYARKERLFNAKALTDISTNELYTGTVSWGKTTKMQGQRPEEFRHHFPELQIVTFETFNAAQAIREDRRRVPSRSQGSAYIFSGLVRCPECGGKTVGKRQWHPEYDYQETKRYVCRRYHTEGRTGCKGWDACEQTVKKAVLPFLVNLLESKLRIREYLEEAAQEMGQERAGDRAQSLQAEVAASRHALAKIQEGYIAEVFNAEEARLRSLEARERIERAERKLKDLKAAKDTREELAGALRLLEMPLGDFLEAMAPEHLAQLCRAVFQDFSIRASGPGWKRRAEMVGYELTPAIKQALTDSVHNVSVRPALEMV